MNNVLYLSPVITGIVEAAKRAGLSNKLCPLLALGLGVVFGFLVPTENWITSVLNGAITGLSAVGCYEVIAKPAFKVLKLNNK